MRIVLAAALAIAGSASASLAEDATGTHYQYDGGTEGDAGDTCLTAEPTLPVNVSTSGVLVPADDVADYYHLEILPEHVGTVISVSLAERSLEIRLDVLVPDCTRSVVYEPELVCDEDGTCREEKHHEPKGKGLGHEMCKGDGHPECKDTEKGVRGDDSVSFVPSQSGLYVIEVRLDVEVGGASSVPMSCHAYCGSLNDKIGYDLLTRG